jgi:hypothetical protein
LKRERKLRKRLRREKKARGEVGTDDEDDDEDDDSLFGSVSVSGVGPARGYAEMWSVG